MNIKRIKKQYKSKGFTLIELMIAIALTTLLTGALYVVAAQASDRKKVNVEVNNLTTMIKKVESATIASDFSGLSNNQVSGMGIKFDSEFQTPMIQGIDAKSYKIVYNSVSARQCADFGPKTQLKISSLQKVITKINGKEFIGADVTGMASACNNTENQVELIVGNNNNLTLAMVAQDAPPPIHITPPDLSIDPARPPSGAVNGIQHENVGGVNTPGYSNLNGGAGPTSTGPNRMGTISNIGPNAPIYVVAPTPPPPPPPPPPPAPTPYPTPAPSGNYTTQTAMTPNSPLNPNVPYNPDVPPVTVAVAPPTAIKPTPAPTPAPGPNWYIDAGGDTVGHSTLPYYYNNNVTVSPYYPSGSANPQNAISSQNGGDTVGGSNNDRYQVNRN